MIRVNVHLSRIDDAVIAVHRQVLAADEVAQARRFLKPADGMLFETGRIQRRLVLAGYLGIDAERLEFAAGEFGKPYLRNADTGHVQFSTSHCAGRAVIAVATGTGFDIGIDIEPLDRPVSDSLMRACLSDDERGWIAKLPPSEQGAAFMQFWTCKEAVMKACGLGLQLDPRAIDISLHRGEVLGLPDKLGNPRDYPIVSRILPGGFALACCLRQAGAHGLDIVLREELRAVPPSA